MLSQLIYASDAADLDDGQASLILKQARSGNRTRDLTGVLVFDGRHFLQVLEGSRVAVTEAFCRIAGDPRHQNVGLISVDDVAERDFPDWTMGYLGMTPEIRDVLTRYQAADGFDPHRLSPAVATSMLRVLRDLDCTA
jgi:hypothetical protein